MSKKTTNKEKPPAFFFYPEKWLSHTNHLDATSYMVYHRVICWMWMQSPDHFSIKNSTKMISTAANVSIHLGKKALAQILDEDFPLLRTSECGKYLISDGLRKAREHQLKVSDKRKKAAEKRWNSNANASLLHDVCISKTMHSSSNSNSSSNSRSISRSDTDKGLLRESTKTERKNATPESVSAVLASAVSPDSVEDLKAEVSKQQASWLERTLRVTKDNPDTYGPWWTEVQTRLLKHGGIGVYQEAVEYAEKCADPILRQAQSLGELKNPAGYVASKCKRFLDKHQETLPQKPKGAESA